MKRVAVLGAGFVAKPAVDYFIDRCGYDVLVTSLKKSEAEKVIGGRAAGRAFALSIDQSERLDWLVGDVDLVMSMIPPSMHMPVARSCLKHQKHMVTTSYISPEMEALDPFCRERGIIILNEIGEDPGLDNMGSKRLIDQVRQNGGNVTGVVSYGAGLPAFEHNTNPMGYKFSWSPKGMILAATAPAAYLEGGKVVQVPASELFDHHRIVEIPGVGSFETYPNRDCTKYLESFGLTGDVSFFRGILRNIGWCDTMKALSALRFFDTTGKNDFAGTTHAAFTAKQIGADSVENIRRKTARFFNTGENADLIRKLEWLGFFEDRKIDRIRGTNADILVDMMSRKMSYAPLERDMVLIHNEITAEFSNHNEKRVSTLLVKGEPGGNSAMSRAVSLPAAIASKLILEDKIKTTGVKRPTLPGIYQPVLEGMTGFGYRFNEKTILTDRTVP